MKKRQVALALAGTLVLTGLAGCGQKESGDSEGSAKKSDVTLTIAAAQDWVKDWDRKVAEDFTKETGIKIDFQLNPNDQYVNIVKAKLASGEGVDIFYANTGQGVLE